MQPRSHRYLLLASLERRPHRLFPGSPRLRYWYWYYRHHVCCPPPTPAVHQAPTTGAGTDGSFVANDGTCRVTLHRYLEKTISVQCYGVVLFWASARNKGVIPGMTMAAVSFLVGQGPVTYDPREFSHNRIPMAPASGPHGY